MDGRLDAEAVTYPSIERDPIRADRLIVRIPGVVVSRTRAAASFDAEDLNAALFHEVQHIRTGLLAGSVQVPDATDEEREFAAIMRDLFLQIVNFGDGDTGRRIAGRAAWRRVATDAVIPLSEAHAYFTTLRASIKGGDASNRFIETQSQGLRTNYGAVLRLLRDGAGPLPHPTRPGATIHKAILDEAPINVRSRIIKFLWSIYLAFDQADPDLVEKAAGMIRRPTQSVHLKNANALIDVSSLQWPWDRNGE